MASNNFFLIDDLENERKRIFYKGEQYYYIEFICCVLHFMIQLLKDLTEHIKYIKNVNWSQIVEGQISFQAKEDTHQRPCLTTPVHPVSKVRPVTSSGTCTDISVHSGEVTQALKSCRKR